ADRPGRLLQLARRLSLVRVGFVGELLQLLLEAGDLRFHRVLSRAELLLRARVAACAAFAEPLNVRGHFLLFGRQLLSLAQRTLDVARAAAGLRAGEAIERVLQPLFRSSRLRTAVA